MLSEMADLSSEGMACLKKIIEKSNLENYPYLYGALDARTGSVIDSFGLIEDLGDTAPFLYYLGLDGLAKKEVEFATNTLKLNPLHVNIRNKRFGNSFIYGYDWTDLILGLIEWYELTGDINAYEFAGSMIDEWKKRFVVSGNFYGIYHPNTKLTLPIASLNDIGMYPELLMRWYQLSGSAENYEIASNIVKAWADDHFFKTHGIFPRVSVSLSCGGYFSNQITWLLKTLKPKVMRSVLFKDNTNFMFSMLAVYEESRCPKLLKSIDDWVCGTKKLLQIDNGGLAEFWGEDGSLGVVSANNFNVIEFLIELYKATKASKYLDYSEQIANFWLARQSISGLIPQKLDDAEISISDTQTDFGVALLKLALITGENKYLLAAIRIGKGILNYHYLEYGMCNTVSLKTNSPEDFTSKTKFLLLSSKLWIAMANFSQLSSNPKLYKILGDR